MVGRNFWVVEEGGAWEVRQEGLPDRTSSHGSQQEAWEIANARAREEHGEVFLGHPQRGYSDYACYRELPRKAKI